VSRRRDPVGCAPHLGTRLHIAESAGRPIEVREHQGLRWMHLGCAAVQSVVRMNRPEQPLLPYTRAMLGALLFHERPRRLLNLGLGGGTFERFLVARTPGLEVTSVESSAAVIDVARRFFMVPEAHPVVHATAQGFLDQAQAPYDLALCDLHGGSGHPQALSGAPFYARVAQCLSPTGVFALNLLPDGEAQMLEVLRAVRTHFEWMLILEFRDYRNIVLFALNRPPPPGAALEARARVLRSRIGIGLGALPARLRRLP